ncbi:MAG: hypothetical protein QXD66_05415 [Candidatus Nezhaarchaeales archaeon]
MEDDVVIHSSESGQVRIIEAVVASIIIFMIFSIAFSMLFSSEKFFKQETVDLNRLAYNVLNRLVEADVIEGAIRDEQVNEAELLSALQNLLPQNILFKLTISKRTNLGNWTTISSISNAPKGVLETSPEVASASITYVSRVGEIYHLSLSLTRSGLASITSLNDGKEYKI